MKECIPYYCDDMKRHLNNTQLSKEVETTIILMRNMVFAAAVSFHREKKGSVNGKQWMRSLEWRDYAWCMRKCCGIQFDNKLFPAVQKFWDIEHRNYQAICSIDRKRRKALFAVDGFEELWDRVMGKQQPIKRHKTGNYRIIILALHFFYYKL